MNYAVENPLKQVNGFKRKCKFSSKKNTLESSYTEKEQPFPSSNINYNQILINKDNKTRGVLKQFDSYSYEKASGLNKIDSNPSIDSYCIKMLLGNEDLGNTENNSNLEEHKNTIRKQNSKEKSQSIEKIENIEKNAKIEKVEKIEKIAKIEKIKKLKLNKMMKICNAYQADIRSIKSIEIIKRSKNNTRYSNSPKSIVSLGDVSNEMKNAHKSSKVENENKLLNKQSAKIIQDAYNSHNARINQIINKIKNCSLISRKSIDCKIDEKASRHDRFISEIDFKKSNLNLIIHKPSLKCDSTNNYLKNKDKNKRYEKNGKKYEVYSSNSPNSLNSPNNPKKIIIKKSNLNPYLNKENNETLYKVKNKNKIKMDGTKTKNKLTNYSKITESFRLHKKSNIKEECHKKFKLLLISNVKERNQNPAIKVDNNFSIINSNSNKKNSISTILSNSNFEIESKGKDQDKDTDTDNDKQNQINNLHQLKSNYNIEDRYSRYLKSIEKHYDRSYIIKNHILSHSSFSYLRRKILHVENETNLLNESSEKPITQNFLKMNPNSKGKNNCNLNIMDEKKSNKNTKELSWVKKMSCHLIKKKQNKIFNKNVDLNLNLIQKPVIIKQKGKKLNLFRGISWALHLFISRKQDILLKKLKKLDCDKLVCEVYTYYKPIFEKYVLNSKFYESMEENNPNKNIIWEKLLFFALVIESSFVHFPNKIIEIANSINLNKYFHSYSFDNPRFPQILILSFTIYMKIFVNDFLVSTNQLNMNIQVFRFLISLCLKTEYNNLVNKIIWKESTSEISNHCFRENGMDKFLRESSSKLQESLIIFRRSMNKIIDLISN